MIKALLFDLDGTLLDMDQADFIRYYLGGLTNYMTAYGYDPKELVAAIWKGTDAMYANDGSQTNYDCFWNVMTGIYGPRVMEDMSIFEQYYQGPFQKIARLSPPNPKKTELVNSLKGKYRLVLSTNPLFPEIAAKSRIKWAGMNIEDFELVTTYEDFHYSKPNPNYFLEVLKKCGLKPEECLVIGNDVFEDGCAIKAGLPLFLLEDFLINTKNLPMDSIPHGSLEDLQQFLEKLDHHQQEQPKEI